MNVQNEDSRSAPVEEDRWLKCYIRSIIDQVMGIEKFREVIVLSLFLLLFLPNMSIRFLMPGPRMWTVVSSGPPDDPKMCPRICHTLQLTADNIEEAFKGNNELYETTAALYIDKISVYKSPLSAPFSSSKDPVRSVMQGQYLSVDYHAYVVFNTSDGMWWALDKTAEGIFVSWGGSLFSVTVCFDGHRRPEKTLGRSDLISDDSDRTVSVLVRRLKYILKSNKYDLIENNCQHFAREIFDKLAIDKTWELSTVSDLTSPLTLLSRLLRNGGYPLAKLVYIVFLFYELYLLSGESREKESYHHLIAVYTVIIVTGIFILIKSLWLILPYSLLQFLLGVLFALFVEARFYSFLGTIRKRAIEYRKKCQSATWFKKYFSLPLGYTMAYVGPVCMMIRFVLIVLVRFVYYIVYAYITSDLNPSPIDLEEFVKNLPIEPIEYFSEISIFVPITLLYILAVIFLNWRN